MNLQTHEVKPVENHIPSGNSAVKLYKFCAYGEENDVDTVRDIAIKMGINIVESVVLEGSAEQIAVFKARLADKGLGYDKQGIINLAVRKA